MQGYYSESIVNYDQSISLKTDYARAYIARGLAKIKIGEHSSGCGDFTKAEELGDKTVQYMIQLYCEKKVKNEEETK